MPLGLEKQLTAPAHFRPQSSPRAHVHMMPVPVPEFPQDTQLNEGISHGDLITPHLNSVGVAQFLCVVYCAVPSYQGARSPLIGHGSLAFLICETQTAADPCHSSFYNATQGHLPRPLSLLVPGCGTVTKSCQQGVNRSLRTTSGPYT